MKSAAELTLAELVRNGAVTPRTVRYYISQGLLPGPKGQGPGARYAASHLDRLRLITRLQQEHLPLAEIRSRLETLDDQQISALAAEAVPQELVETEPPSGQRALAYIRSVIGKPHLVDALPAQAKARPAEAAPPAPSASSPDRSTWERVALSADIELHVRRPLDRQSNKKLDQLLAAARAIFKRE